MATYILLLTLTPEGREKALADPDSLRRAEAAIRVPGTQVLGLYGVLGQYDFVSILDAQDNAAVAQFSLELGVRAGVFVNSLPAIPISRFEHASDEPVAQAEADPPLARPSLN